MHDRLWRAGLWVAFRLARMWWWLRRPDHHGVIVAIWHGGAILGIRQSYRREMTFPGGGIRSGEDEAVAAARELREELGLELRPADLMLARRVTELWDHRRDHVRIFEYRPAVRPLLRLDMREVVSARFLAPLVMLSEPLPPFVRAYLEDSIRSMPATHSTDREN